MNYADDMKIHTSVPSPEAVDNGVNRDQHSTLIPAKWDKDES